jgi:hypothetical protein
MPRAAFEVDRYRLKDIGAKFFPCLGFGEDAMTKRAQSGWRRGVRISSSRRLLAGVLRAVMPGREHG